MTRKSLGRLSFETFADRYAELTLTKPHNAYYEPPAAEPCFLCIRARKPGRRRGGATEDDRR